MKKLLILIVILIVILGATLVSIPLLIAKTPSLIGALGLNKPKDLGITVTKEQQQAAYEKVGVVASTIAAPSGTVSRVLSGTKPAQFDLTSEEITAVVKNLGRWKDYPLHDVQIRINADNSVEATGIIDSGKAIDYAMQLGYARDDIAKVMDQYHIPMIAIPFAVKGSGSITNNRSAITIESATVSQIPIPGGIISDNNKAIASVVNMAMEKSPGFYAESITVADGKIHFQGKTAAEDRYIAR